MTLNEVIKKEGYYDEKFETVSGTWVLQIFSCPFAYTEYEFTADQQTLIDILEYDITATPTIQRKSVEEYEKRA